MTIEKPKPGAPGTMAQSPGQEPSEATRSREKPRDAGKTKDDEPLSEEEKIKREQATNPALMPIGDPAGAA
ncbi:hypothetical protein [Shinella sp.]|uniref:hypothetical protein n=1 Tax=Shinella sp. TaxID=1870904 RepID=UPI004036928B